MSARILLLLCFLLSVGQRVVARPVAGTANLAHSTVVQVWALPDRGYSWHRIRTDATLPYGPADSLQPARARRFWLKIALRNPSHYAEAGQLTVLPNLDNTLFYFNEDARAWHTRRAGVAVPTDYQRVKGPLSLRLPGRATTVVYVLVRLGPRAALPAAVQLKVSLAAAAGARQTEDFFRTAWAVSLAVLGLLLLTNLPVYARFRDRATLYYLCTQVGAVLYITAFRGYFKAWWPAPVFSQLVLHDGRSYAYTLNSALIHLGVLLLVLGSVRMTRAYLSLPTHLPRLDAALRRALLAYATFTGVVALVNGSGFYLENYTLLFDNVLVLGVLGLLLATTVVAYRRRLPLAGIYLLGNALPLACVLLMTTYNIVFSFDSNGTLLLPDLAIVSHALCFAAALSIRLQSVQQTLLATVREADTLALDIREQELRHREIVLKNQHIQTALLEMQRRQQARDQHTRQLSEANQELSATNQQHESANLSLQAQLETNQRELASTTLYVQQKNALLAELKQQIKELNTQSPAQQKELAGIKSILQTNLYLDEDWGKFKLHFEQVHPRFFEELQARYPALTKNEQRLFSYFHINLTTKEIAALLNIDPASVRRAKTRLFKKVAAADQAAGRTPAAPAAAPDERTAS